MDAGSWERMFLVNASLNLKMYKNTFSLTQVALEQLCRMMSWHYQIKFGNKKRIDICWTKFTVI